MIRIIDAKSVITEGKDLLPFPPCAKKLFE